METTLRLGDFLSSLLIRLVAPPPPGLGGRVAGGEDVTADETDVQAAAVAKRGKPPQAGFVNVDGGIIEDGRR